MEQKGTAQVQVWQRPPQESARAGVHPQRTCACGQHTIAGGECSTCRSEQSTLLRSQRAFGPPSAPVAVQGNAPAQENVPSFNSVFDRASRFGHDFSRIPIHPPAAGAIQTKLAINKPGDEYEQEADRISERVMRMPESQLQHTYACGGVCPQCQTEPLGHGHERLHTKRVGSSDLEQTAVPPIVHEVLRSPGQSLDPATRTFMEPRFGHDFSQVRVHTDAKAVESAWSVNALAYTVGRDVVFANGHYSVSSSEGKKLIAHELTHVVQQSNGRPLLVTSQRNSIHRLPVPADAVVADAKDAAEVEADQVAMRVASGQSAGPIRAPASNVLHAQPAPKPKKKPDWEPEVEAETRSANVKVGKTVSLKFHVSNERTAPKGTTFDWRGIRLNESDAITIVGFSDHVGAHATLVVKGRAAGISEVGTTVYFKTPGAQEDYENTPRVRVEVGSEIEAAEAELAQIEKLHAEGKEKEVEPSRESAAHQEAVAAAKNTLGKARHAAGTEISEIFRRVNEDIDQIQNARHNGYQNALTDLNLTQLDEKEQEGRAQSFALSLAGNLIWALSGLIAITPVGLEAALATGLIAKLGKNLGEASAKTLASRLVQLEAVHRARVITAINVGAALLVSFANGFPSGPSGGGNVSEPLIQLRDLLGKFDDDVFKAMKRDVDSTLLRLLDIAPPEQDVDAQQYAGRLETGIRRVLFNGYYENGGATGNQVNPDVIEKDARNQLLRRLVVSSGKISGEGIESTKLEEHGLGKLVKPAVKLVHGTEALKLGDYEFVAEQLQRTCRALGLEGLPNVDADQLRKDFAQSNTIVLSARVTDGGVSITVAIRGLLFDSVELSADGGVSSPMMDFDPGSVYPQITEVLSIEIRKKDLTSAKIGKGGTLVYSTEKFWIRARGYLGPADRVGEYRGEQVPKEPVTLWLIYKV